MITELIKRADSIQYHTFAVTCVFQRQRFVELNESILMLGSYFQQGTQRGTAVAKDRLPENLRHVSVWGHIYLCLLLGSANTRLQVYGDCPTEGRNLNSEKKMFLEFEETDTDMFSLWSRKEQQG